MDLRTSVCAAGMLLSMAGGCVDEKRVIDTHERLANDGGTDGGGYARNLCDGTRCLQVERGTDKVDLLFMIDNSNSMREEQSALLDQIPALIEALSSGDVDGDGEPEYGAARDLHLGVVSSDMGLIGIEHVDGCSGFGNDGLLQHQPSRLPSQLLSGCDASYPPFLSYTSPDDLIRPDDFSREFSCIAMLGTGGCGFEQQLESPLKALWPSAKQLPGVADGVPNFLTDAQRNGGLGHGDLENSGFLRNDAKAGASLIGVVLITDEDDGSSANTHHFTPPTDLNASDPLVTEPLNLRNHFHPQELYPVERYIQGFKALRPGHEDMVVFGAITGVPPELVQTDALEQADRSDATRDAFYQKLLDDEQMQERIDAASQVTPGNGNLIPACMTANGKAYPARRIVQTARGFGENGFVQSICEKDYRGAIGELARRIGRRVATNCLPEKIIPHGCHLRALLAPDQSCTDVDLQRHVVWSDTSGDAGVEPHEICDVPGNSWHYDDTSETAARCKSGARIGVATSLPGDAELYMDCVN